MISLICHMQESRLQVYINHITAYDFSKLKSINYYYIYNYVAIK